VIVYLLFQPSQVAAGEVCGVWVAVDLGRWAGWSGIIVFYDTWNHQVGSVAAGGGGGELFAEQ
jgi:hypothetical protein